MQDLGREQIFPSDCTKIAKSKPRTQGAIVFSYGVSGKKFLICIKSGGEVPTYFRIHALARIRFRGGRSAVRRHRIFSIDRAGHLKPSSTSNVISDGKSKTKEFSVFDLGQCSLGP
jgi:hypothetical protein